MSANPKDVLKARLAAGEISIDEYRELLAEICDEVMDEGRNHIHNQSDALSTGKLITEFEDLRLFENAIIHKNIAHPLSDITSVRGGQSEQSFNFLPTEKSSSLSIAFISGESIAISEQRILFGGKRHEAIGKLLAILRKATFNPCLSGCHPRNTTYRAQHIEKPLPIVGRGC